MEITLGLFIIKKLLHAFEIILYHPFEAALYVPDETSTLSSFFKETYVVL